MNCLEMSNFGNFVVAFRAGKVEVTQNPVSRQVDERIGLLASVEPRAHLSNKPAIRPSDDNGIDPD